MEQRLSDRSSDAVSVYPHGRQFFVANLHQTSPNRDNSKIEQRQIDQFIFNEAVEIAGDWLDASGGAPLNKKQYDNLFRSGYASHPSSEILRIFHDWEDFQQVSATYHQDRLKEEEQKQTALLEAIQRERELGLLPDELFKEAIPYTVRYCEVNPKNGQRGKVKKLQRAQVTENDANTEKVLERYAKYSLINYLLRDRPGDDAPTEERKVSMAMGFSIESGKALSSFKGSLKNSNSMLSDVDIDEAIEKLDIHHLIYPDSRQEHLDELLLNTEAPLYDIKAGRMLGKTAILAYVKAESKPKHIKELSELLLDEKLSLNFAELNPYKYREWDKEKFIEYGRWLLGVIEPHNRELTARMLRRAHKLNLGPGIDGIISERAFGNLVNFYNNLGLKKLPKGRCADWEEADFVSWIKIVAEENEGYVTREKILERIRDGKEEPSIKLIIEKIGSLSKLLEVAGLTPYHKMTSMEECISIGVEFVRQNDGRFPEKRDFRMNTILPSLNPIYKYCGGIVNYRRLIKEALSGTTQAYDYEDEQLAA